MDDLQDPARALNELDDVLAAMRYNENRSARIGDLAKKHGISESQVRHVLDGEASGGAGSGGHFAESQNIRLSNETVDPVTGDIVKADIEIYNPNSGRFHPKHQKSSFFPTDWKEPRVLAEINHAFSNSTTVVIDGNRAWEGMSTTGFTITGSYDQSGSWKTGWPL